MVTLVGNTSVFWKMPLGSFFQDKELGPGRCGMSLISFRIHLFV